MPQVQFVDPANSIRKTAYMPTPKRMAEIDYWFKAARKAIPMIPNLKDGLWHLERQEANLDYIAFHLRSREGERNYVVILRNADAIGDSRAS